MSGNEKILTLVLGLAGAAGITIQLFQKIRKIRKEMEEGDKKKPGSYIYRGINFPRS